MQTVPQLGFVCCSSHDETRVMGLGQEDRRSQEPL